MMDRRAFIGTLAGSFLGAPFAVEAQESIQRTRVAFLGAESGSTNQHFVAAFRQGLREHGYVDGQNLTLEERWAEGQSERFPALIGELVRLKARVILTVSLPAALAAKRAATAIPIVFIAGDPLGSGLVDSLARPGGNLTGLSISLGEDFSGKWLELLREAAQALVAVVDPLTVRYRGRIAELAAKYRLPAMYGLREFADAGGFMAYGANVADLCRRAATYVDKILKGAKPGDLPVEQPAKFELVINLKTAKALGLTIPLSLLQRADQVIE